MGFNVIIDTREKTPWDMTNACSSIDNITVQKIETGDYAIEGMEDVLCLERKKSVAEIANNITKDRFWNEMERMKAFPHAFLVLEFSVDDVLQFPVGSNVPKYMWSKMRVKGEYIMIRLSTIQVDYGIDVIFCGDTDNAIKISTNIMQRVYAKSFN